MATMYAPLHRVTPEEYRRATEVTYLGNVYGTMAKLKRMRPRNRGTIVQVGSALAYRAIPLQAPYCGAKFAIRGFTDSLRSELRALSRAAAHAMRLVSHLTLAARAIEAATQRMSPDHTHNRTAS
jgi:NADP-dependent 3-hydroxy acid dehydrogenase YdfG